LRDNNKNNTKIAVNCFAFAKFEASGYQQHFSTARRPLSNPKFSHNFASSYCNMPSLTSKCN